MLGKINIVNKNNERIMTQEEIVELVKELKNPNTPQRKEKLEKLFSISLVLLKEKVRLNKEAKRLKRERIKRIILSGICAFVIIVALYKFGVF